MITEEKVMESLREVIDPELGLNIVDLGLIYDVRIEGNKVAVKMTLTAPGCPLHETISGWVRSKLKSLKGVSDAKVEVVWDPPWHPTMMAEGARKQFGY